ncbi:MAG: FAD-binding oxidoreductase [Actinomycetota bacterium]|nr:FAD-binding oxidoreductase [Actinomycetota bacterium]
MNMRAEEILKRLEDVVGPEYVSVNPAVLDGYAFQSFGNLDPTCPWISRPVAVVLPSSTEEVQAVLRACHELGLRFKAFSTGWGAHGGPGGEGVVQIDLRRMDRIIDIDERNMVAVVEPYVICAQLQAEAMKRGLNLHIIGAGCGTSPLASCTSMDGTGWTGLSTGYNCRNVLGVEWVLPDGQVLRLGSAGSGSGWFCGDGPGPSLRGVMRGLFGARSSLGVFTKCAVKLYPWPGDPCPEVRGTLLDLETSIPENFRVYMCLFPSFESYADFAYGVADAEIGFLLCKNALGLIISIFMPRLLKKISSAPYLKGALMAAEHVFQFMLASHSPGELEYQEKVARELAERCGGLLLDLGLAAGLGGAVWWGLVRGALPPLSFRMGGMMGTSFGTCAAFDNCVNQSRAGAELKRAFIEKGKLFDDLADNAWGGIYEATGLYGHQEELFLFDHRNPEHREGAREYSLEACRMMREMNFGVGLGAFMLDAMERDQFFGPSTWDYPSWQRKIKEALDPDGLGDSRFYSAE